MEVPEDTTRVVPRHRAREPPRSSEALRLATIAALDRIGNRRSS